VIFATRRNFNTRSDSLSTVFHAPMGRDSEKPEEFYDLVRRASFPPYGEAFQRTARRDFVNLYAAVMFIGLGPKDALRLPRNFYRDGEIATRRSKTGEPVYWPAPAELRTILASAPAHHAITLCTNSNGKPWTESGFRASWRPIRLKLEKAGAIGAGLTMYGLRHTVAVILRESGFDERTIADAFGQKTIEMARHYAEGGPQAEDAKRGCVLRCGIEQAANKSCQTTQLKLSNLLFGQSANS
jgi:integrase